MDYLNELSVKTMENLDYTNICVDLPLNTDTLLNDSNRQPKLDMMNNEEIELALSCAMNIKKHLTRVLELNSEEVFQHKLQYVNNLIQEGGLRAKV